MPESVITMAGISDQNAGIADQNGRNRRSPSTGTGDRNAPEYAADSPRLLDVYVRDLRRGDLPA
jgi:hypothetical protein